MGWELRLRWDLGIIYSAWSIPQTLSLALSPNCSQTGFRVPLTTSPCLGLPEERAAAPALPRHCGTAPCWWGLLAPPPAFCCSLTTYSSIIVILRYNFFFMLITYWFFFPISTCFLLPELKSQSIFLTVLPECPTIVFYRVLLLLALS